MLNPAHNFARMSHLQPLRKDVKPPPGCIAIVEAGRQQDVCDEDDRHEDDSLLRTSPAANRRRRVSGRTRRAPRNTGDIHAPLATSFNKYRRVTRVSRVFPYKARKQKQRIPGFWTAQGAETAMAAPTAAVHQDRRARLRHKASHEAANGEDRA